MFQRRGWMAVSVLVIGYVPVVALAGGEPPPVVAHPCMPLCSSVQASRTEGGL